MAKARRPSPTTETVTWASRGRLAGEERPNGEGRTAREKETRPRAGGPWQTGGQTQCGRLNIEWKPNRAREAEMGIEAQHKVGSLSQWRPNQAQSKG